MRFNAKLCDLMLNYYVNWVCCFNTQKKGLIAEIFLKITHFFGVSKEHSKFLIYYNN